MDGNSAVADFVRPLIVDMDGTLFNGDLLIESFAALMSLRPLRSLLLLGELRHGKAAFKSAVAQEISFNANVLPFNENVLQFLRGERARGRKIYLASASDRRLTECVANEVGLFDGVYASDGQTNLSSTAKANALCESFGENGFDYMGNALPDLDVWAHAKEVLIVDAPPLVRRRIMARFPQAQEISCRTVRPRDYLKALRAHQWAKNLLVFAPVFAAHNVSATILMPLMLAFFSFSLCASSGYIVNDLLDLANDRRHPRKRERPFASGRISSLEAPPLIFGTLALALAFGAALPSPFIGVLISYYIGTLAYSLWLKRKMTIDVLALACLYGIRIVAGAVAAHVPLSPWFVAFSIFLFLGLALVKRCAELVSMTDLGRDRAAGRGYLSRDLPVLESMAAASSYVAVIVFILYINSPAVLLLYRRPQFLWLICLVLLYWIGRMLVLTHRGEMHDDPVVFAVTDSKSRLCAALIAAIAIASI